MAQSPVTLMPEGSKDVTIGVLTGTMPKYEGRTERTAFLIPMFSVRWSNGFFLEGLTAGMQLSSTPHLQYGPLLALDLGSARPYIPGEKGKKRLVPGAFLSYRLLHNLSLQSSIIHGATPDGKGLLATGSAAYGMPLAPHHHVSLAAGLNWGNRDYMQSYFDVAPEDAAGGRLPAYEASSGIKGVFVRARWSWQASRKYTLGSAVTFTQLRGSAAASPFTQTPNGVSYVASVNYRF